METDISNGRIRRLGGELVTRRVAGMFGRNTVASTIAFALDLLILYALIEWLALHRMAAAAIAFMVPTLVFYVLLRTWVFPATSRSIGSGFLYLMLNLGIGFVIMLAVFWTLLELTAIHYLVARIVASVVSGIVIFLLNGVFNFKQL